MFNLKKIHTNFKILTAQILNFFNESSWHKAFKIAE